MVTITFLAIASIGETTADAQASGPSARNSAATGATKGSATSKDAYRDLKKEDGIQFAIHGEAYLSGGANSEKSYIIGEFGLVDSAGTFIPLELIDDNVFHGVIRTKKIGNIIRKSTDPDVYSVTEAQVKQLQELQSAQARKPTAPPGSRGATWTDASTGLMWTRKDNGFDVTQKQAADFCQNLDLSGFRDWRLPTIDELSGLYNGPKTGSSGVYGTGSTKHVKGDIALTGMFTWSSSIGNYSNQGLIFFFAEGSRASSPARTPDSMRALCVRRAGK